jgi:predicted AAA+ superfamily ATPase
VIAAGSLLEFTLAEHSFSMPVGRVSFLHIEPMGFAEFLRAHEQQRLLATLAAWRPRQALSAAAHELATTWFHRYAMVGGMPAIVQADATGASPRECRVLQADLVATYRADFAKYSGRMDRAVIDATLRSVAGSIGRKFVYSRVGEGVKRHQAKAALERLAQARLCHLVTHTAANGLPLGAEAKARTRKAVLADVGLLHALLGTPAAQAFPSWDSLAPSLRGQLGDQLVAQQLRLAADAAGDGPELFYWQREGGRPAEIDFIVQVGTEIIPVEVKAGAGGTMRSLHQFMHDKRLERALRCDANPPSLMRIDLSTTQGQAVSYDLLSLPLYLCWNVEAIMADQREP